VCHLGHYLLIPALDALISIHGPCRDRHCLKSTIRLDIVRLKLKTVILSMPLPFGNRSSTVRGLREMAQRQLSFALQIPFNHSDMAAAALVRNGGHNDLNRD
jgi:hypothetical protein